jgi:putative nucleotidyltransferase with HDIG domain
MSDTTSPTSLKKAIRNLDTLPAMPVIAQKILALDLDSDAGERDLLKLIEQDPQLSARIVGLANTPLFGPSKKVSSVSDSAMLLGITRVKSVTLGIAMMSSLAKNPTGKLDTKALWLHSLSIALALRAISRAMPRHTRPLDDEIFLAGLLHDIGYMVLNHLDPKSSDELHTRFAKEKDRPAAEIEAELLEMDHCQLGAELASYWELPESVVAILRYHHDPENEHAEVGQPLVSMVNLAEKILPPSGVYENPVDEITPEEWTALGIDPAKAEELLVQIKEEAAEAAKTAGSFA